jgi:hypothetical protein
MPFPNMQAPKNPNWAQKVGAGRRMVAPYHCDDYIYFDDTQGLAPLYYCCATHNAVHVS